MQVFTIHLRQSAVIPGRDAVLVKEGFCWLAFFFGPFWALWHRMWLTCLCMLSVLIASGAAEVAFQLNPLTFSAVMIGIATIIGFCANDWRRAKLTRLGWKMEGLSAASDRDLALRRFIDLHPDAMDMCPSTDVFDTAPAGTSSHPTGN